MSLGYGGMLHTLIDLLTDEELWQQSAGDVLIGEFNVPLPASKHAVYSGGRVWTSDGEFIYWTSGKHQPSGLFHVAYFPH